MGTGLVADLFERVLTHVYNGFIWAMNTEDADVNEDGKNRLATFDEALTEAGTAITVSTIGDVFTQAQQVAAVTPVGEERTVRIELRAGVTLPATVVEARIFNGEVRSMVVVGQQTARGQFVTFTSPIALNIDDRAAAENKIREIVSVGSDAEQVVTGAASFRALAERFAAGVSAGIRVETASGAVFESTILDEALTGAFFVGQRTSTGAMVLATSPIAIMMMGHDVAVAAAERKIASVVAIIRGAGEVTVDSFASLSTTLGVEGVEIRARTADGEILQSSIGEAGAVSIATLPADVSDAIDISSAIVMTAGPETVVPTEVTVSTIGDVIPQAQLEARKTPLGEVGTVRVTFRAGVMLLATVIEVRILDGEVRGMVVVGQQTARGQFVTFTSPIALNIDDRVAAENKIREIVSIGADAGQVVTGAANFTVLAERFAAVVSTGIRVEIARGAVFESTVLDKALTGAFFVGQRTSTGAMVLATSPIAIMMMGQDVDVLAAERKISSVVAIIRESREVTVDSFASLSTTLGAQGVTIRARTADGEILQSIIGEAGAVSIATLPADVSDAIDISSAIIMTVMPEAVVPTEVTVSTAEEVFTEAGTAIGMKCQAVETHIPSRADQLELIAASKGQEADAMGEEVVPEAPEAVELEIPEWLQAANLEMMRGFSRKNIEAIASEWNALNEALETSGIRNWAKDRMREAFKAFILDDTVER